MAGESTTPNVLLVPMHLDALCLPSPTRVREALAQYTRLPFTYKNADDDYVHSNDRANISENILSQPFSPTFQELAPGIHLHWALPDTLTRSTGSDLSGRHRFPIVPNRWLVRRLRGDSVERQWVVESDYLYPDLTVQRPQQEQPVAAIIPFPRTRLKEGPYQPFRHIGRAMQVTDWQSSGSSGEYLRQHELALTAMGPLEWHASLDHVKASFAAFYPGCFSVFGFHDPDATLGADPSGVSYDVLGWYDRPDDDVLKDFYHQHQSETDRIRVRQDFERRFRWQVDLGQAALPRRTVCHARLTFQGATRNNPAASQKTLTLSVGDTGTEALSAYLAHQLAEDPDTRRDVARQLDALEFTDQLDQLQLDVDEKFHEARHERGFTARAGGTLWSIQRANPASDTEGEEVTLPDDVAHLLSELNQLQGAYDRANEATASMSSRLFNDWHKFIYATHPEAIGDQMGEDQPTDAEDLSDAMQTLRANGLATLREHLLATGKLGWKQPRNTQQVVGAPETLRFGLVNAGSTQYFREYREDLDASYISASSSHWAKEFKNFGITLSSSATVKVVAEGGEEGEGRVWNILDGGRTYVIRIEKGLMSLDIPPFAEQLAARLLRAMDALQRRVWGLTPPCALRATPGPRYWQPNDPVVLMHGESLSRGVRHGRDGRLQKDGLLACQLLEGISDESLDRLPLEEALLGRIRQLIDASPASQSGERAGFTTWTQQPWNPFLLEWDVQFFPHPVPKVDGRDAYPPDHITRRYVRAPEAVDLARREPDDIDDVVTNSEPYRGFSILSAHTSGTLKQRIASYVVKQRLLLPEESHQKALYGLTAAQAEQYLDTDGNAQALLSGYQPEPGEEDDTLRTALRAYVTLQSQEEHILSQALNGFNDALLMQKRTLQLDIEDPIGFDDHRLFASQVAGTVRGALLLASTPKRDFNPFRGGELRITGLRLVDTFGQLNDLDTRPDEGGTTIVSSELMPLRDRGENDHRVLLAPRLAQPSRIQFRWLSGMPLGGEDQPEMNAHPATSPICGWLIPNNFDGGLMVYATSGTPLGVINAAGYWDPFPGTAHPVAVEAIENPHLRKVVDHLTSAGRAGQDYTKAFGTVLNAALDQSDPEALSHSPSLSLLIGRPLAVVRASVDLELHGLPARDKRWRVFNGTLAQYQDGEVPTPISQSPESWTLGFDQVELPIRIGEFRQFNDGLLGYWKEQADGRFENGTFYAPQSEHAGFSGTDPAGRSIVTASGNRAVEIPQTVSAPAQILTMLVDPRGEVHATSSLVPTKSIRIPPEQYEKALASLEVTFTSAPLLTGRAAYGKVGGEREVSVPVPEQPGFTWSWVSRQRGLWEETRALTPAETRARMPDALQLAEGWLKLSRETPPGGSNNHGA
ncbi:hypothetical protein F0U62_00990 [Cystobacter fuscus]|uniref:hypothetical protein n=1 Tax=Cystobacter fuscus TaxID=43 RepID=UPI002B2A21F9|nr:hypothetical protein F0U62_00990 [Cystobacter fuscus]